MRRALGLALAVVAVFAIDSVIAAPRDVPQDVYIWQRHWTPAVRGALAESRTVFSGVRVLVAQGGRDDRWAPSDVEPDDFAGDSRALVAVVRYDGAGDPPDVGKLDAFLHALLGKWREAGRAFAGVEIDYDCGAKRLADYASRLRALRRNLAPGVALSVTALPAWLGSGDLESVIGATDETVLQLHAVNDPATSGLFDARAAERATRAFARRTAKPFRVALPAYGYRVRPAAGGAYAVEAEMPVDVVETGEARELAADPREVLQALRALQVDPPPNWRGVAWFRLPVDGDRRAWTLAAMREVIESRMPESNLAPLALARANGATDLFIANDGDADAKPPALQASGSDCGAADATTGWTLEQHPSSLRFVPAADARIRARSRVAVGWIRCDGDVHVRLETD